MLLRPEYNTQIIAAAASGDREAFRSLVLAHQSQVRGLLHRLTGFDEARADDLAQEVFLTVFERLKSFRYEANFKSWLYRIAYNVYIDDHRAAARKEMASEEEAPEPSVLPNTDEALDMQKVLHKGLAALKREERTAVVLTAVEELTHEEAAATMGIPLGTLKSHVLRGKEQLQTIFRKHGLEVTL